MSDFELQGWHLWSNVKDILHKEHLTRVIEKAYTYMKKHPGQTMIEKAARKIHIDGFRPLAAPQPKIIKEILSAIEKDQSKQNLYPVIDTWIKAEMDLYNEIKDGLASNQAGLEKLTNYVQDNDKEAITEIIADLAHRMPLSNEYDEKDVKLMLCYVIPACAEKIDDIPSSDKASDTDAENVDSVIEEPVALSLWEQHLAAISSIPADAAEWSALEDFIVQLRKIGDEKSRKREQAEFHAKLFEDICKLIGSLRDSYAVDLEFFDIALTSSEVVQKLHAEKMAELHQHLSELKGFFDTYRALKQKPIKKAAEEKQQQREIELVHQQIAALSEQMPKDSPEETIRAAVDDTECQSLDNETDQDSSSLLEAEEGSVADESAGCPKEQLSSDAEDQSTLFPDNPDSHEPTYPGAQPEFAPPNESNESEQNSTTSLLNHNDAVAKDQVLEQESAVRHPDGSPAMDFWHMLERDDLAGAYWHARSVNGQENAPDISFFLIAALFGSRLITQDTQRITADMLEIARSYDPDFNNPEEGVLALATALRSSLVAPGSGMLAWLQTPATCSYTHELVQLLASFAGRMPSLRQEDLLGFANNEQRQSAIRKISADAKAWLEQARHKRLKIKRANDIWLGFIGSKGDIALLLEQVGADRRTAVDEIHRKVKLYSDENWLETCINEKDVEFAGKKREPITGIPREQLLRNVKEACHQIEAWCNLVIREKQFNESGRDWVSEQLLELRNAVRPLLPGLYRNLHDKASAASFSMKVSLQCLETSLRSTAAVLGISSDDSMDKTILCDVQPEWGLYDVLRQRLFLLYELELDDQGEPLETQLESVSHILKVAENRSFQEALTGWMEKMDYRFVDRLVYNQDQSVQEELERHWQEGLHTCKAFIGQQVTDTENKIEQAMVDGIIDEARSEYSAILEESRCGASLNFRASLERLQKIREAIDSERDKRIAEQVNNWTVLQKQLSNSSLSEEKRHQIIKVVNETIQRKDTRATQECFDQLAEMYESGKEFDESAFHVNSDVSNQSLYQFLDQVEPITIALSDGTLQRLISSIKNERSWGKLNFSHRSRTYLDSTRKGLEAWKQLKDVRESGRNNEQLLQDILTSIGFNMVAGETQPVQIISRDDHRMHAKVRMKTGGHSPVPQFGTYQRDLFDVICLWERPTTDSIIGWLRDSRMENHNVLVLFLGRLRLRPRCQIKQASRERGLAMAVLDESLLAFLSDKENRLAQFFRCSLPFASINPYTPFQAGDVPPEMFFGRRRMAKELQMPAGSCLVYGGRQLGKSALLRHVQREFHHPDQERYAHVEDIKLFSSSRIGMPPDMIWTKIWQAFQNFGLVDGTRITPADSEQIIQLIKQTMQRRKNSRVLLLFDEADAFLDADRHREYAVCDQLRILMQELEHRVKIVFAGLHSVQRFWGDRNQPLAHYGAALCVGPLEADAAQSLIREPFETLGYKFKDHSVVLNILSYTNYHPGLIQLFCQQLLQRMNNVRIGRDEPPYWIDRSDVEAVYRMQDLRDRFRERFDWTLALDKRYQAIAWSLILDQISDANSFARSYSTAQVLKLVRDAWPAGVENLSFLQFGSLMNEMCGLGVLLRNREGYYRLRSPNVVRMLGNPDDIELRLIQLADECPVQEDIDSYHAPLDCSGKKYRPFTDAQERALGAQNSVTLIFGSNATGLGLIPDALKRFAPSVLLQDGRAEIKPLSPTVKTGQGLIKWVDDYLKRHEKCQWIAIYKHLDGSEDAADLVQKASECIRIRRRQTVRIFFLFDPLASWQWLQQPQNKINDLENLVDSVVVLQRWSRQAILNRLSQRDMLHSEEVCQKIFDATQGWPTLLDKLLKIGKNHDDLRQVVDQLLVSETDITDFIVSLGCKNIPLADEFIRILSQNSVPSSWLSEESFPELVGLSGVTSEEACRTVQTLSRLGIVEEDSNLIVDSVIGRLWLR